MRLRSARAQWPQPRRWYRVARSSTTSFFGASSAGDAWQHWRALGQPMCHVCVMFTSLAAMHCMTSVAAGAVRSDALMAQVSCGAALSHDCIPKTVERLPGCVHCPGHCVGVLCEPINPNHRTFARARSAEARRPARASRRACSCGNSSFVSAHFRSSLYQAQIDWRSGIRPAISPTVHATQVRAAMAQQLRNLACDIAAVQPHH
jgi:hypothetical protein